MVGRIAPALGISGMEYEGCNYLMFRMERGTEKELLESLLRTYADGHILPIELLNPKELPIFEKYDEYVPGDLLRHAYSVDRLNMDEAIKRINQMNEEL